MSETTHQVHEGHSKTEGEQKIGGKKNLKWWLIGGGAGILLLFLFIRKSGSSGTAAAATAPASTGLDPNTIAALEQAGLLGGSGGVNGTSGGGYGGSSGSWWGGGGEAINTGTSGASTSGGSTVGGGAAGGTAGGTTGTGISPISGNPLPAQNGGQLEYTTSGGQTLAQIAKALGTTVQSLISDTISGHGNVNNGKFSSWLQKSKMGATGNVPGGLKLYYTPGGKG